MRKQFDGGFHWFRFGHLLKPVHPLVVIPVDRFGAFIAWVSPTFSYFLQCRAQRLDRAAHLDGLGEIGSIHSVLQTLNRFNLIKCNQQPDPTVVSNRLQ